MIACLPGNGMNLAFRPDLVRVRDADRDDGRVRPQRQKGEPVLRLLELARRAARALGKDHQDVPSPEDPLRDAERPRRPPRRDPPARRRRYGRSSRRLGQSNISFLPSQWIRRPSRGVRNAPINTASAFEMWFAARMTAPSFGIAFASPLDPHPRETRGPRTGRPARPSRSAESNRSGGAPLPNHGL